MVLLWLPAHVRRNGAVQFYAKDLSGEELAEAPFYMTWLDSADGSGGSGGLSAGAIAGIAVGSAVAVAAAAAAAVFMVQRRRRPPVTDAEAAIRVLKVRQRLRAGGPPAPRCTAQRHPPPVTPSPLLRAVAGCGRLRVGPNPCHDCGGPRPSWHLALPTTLPTIACHAARALPGSARIPPHATPPACCRDPNNNVPLFECCRTPTTPAL